MRHLLISALFFILFLFIVNGFTWQALDEEEFPDSELPGWFVRTFRNRPREDGPHKNLVQNGTSFVAAGLISCATCSIICPRAGQRTDLGRLEHGDEGWHGTCPKAS